MSYKTDLSVSIGSAQFANPVIPASGTYDYFENNADLFPMSELGAVMIKSVHRQVRPGNPGPRICEVTGGMLNAVGIPSIGMEAFLEKELPKYETIGTQVILSISGSVQKDYEEALELIHNDPRIAAVELNLSCPNVGSGLAFSAEPVVTEKTVAAARKHTKLPLIPKLTPNTANIRETAKAAEAAGADGITVSNTFKAMKIDIEKQRPVLGNISGGMSGPAVKPQNMYLVWEAYNAVKIPILASGGVSDWKDAIEYFLAGATMVQVGCINFVNPMAMPQIIEGIDAYLAKHGYASLKDIRGLAHQL